jgi:general secretion pathway protein I
MNLKPTKAQGFTLIEVMIALSVVAIGLMACIKAMNEEISAANLTRDKMLALWVVENKVAEIRLNPAQAGTGLNQGRETLFNQTWHWQTHPVQTANSKIRKVEIKVFADTDKSRKNPLFSQNIYLADLK